MVSKKTKDKLELRKKIRDRIQAGRPMSTPASARAASSKASPRQRTPVGGEQVVSAAAVLQSMSSVEERIAADRVRPANLARLSMSSVTGILMTTAFLTGGKDS
jgi:N-acetylmuramoyl-L-alanine amidase